jgi:hypothetical protein
LTKPIDLERLEASESGLMYYWFWSGGRREPPGAESIEKVLRLLRLWLKKWFLRRRERREVHFDCKKSIKSRAGSRREPPGGAGIRKIRKWRRKNRLTKPIDLERLEASESGLMYYWFW